MCTKFQVDWTSNSSKTTLTNNFNLKDQKLGLEAWQTDGRTNGRSDRKNTMPINGAYKCCILDKVYILSCQQLYHPLLWYSLKINKWRIVPRYDEEAPLVNIYNAIKGSIPITVKVAPPTFELDLCLNKHCV